MLTFQNKHILNYNKKKINTFEETCVFKKNIFTISSKFGVKLVKL